MEMGFQGNKDELLSRKDAAQYLGVSEGTLAVWASTGRYPLRYTKIGRLTKYRLSDLVDFIEKNSTGGREDMQ